MLLVLCAIVSSIIWAALQPILWMCSVAGGGGDLVYDGYWLREWMFVCVVVFVVSLGVSVRMRGNRAVEK